MTEQERGLIFLCSLLGPIPFVWFITAKFVYGINSETAHYLVPYLLKNTFNLWPLWVAIIAGAVIGLCQVMCPLTTTTWRMSHLPYLNKMNLIGGVSVESR